MSADFDDPDKDAAWCDERRADVIAYLQHQGVSTGAVGDAPAWHVAPYVSVWAIESKQRPGAVGWWAISGDLPTDYVSAAASRHPRDAMRELAERWRRLSEKMARGEADPDTTIGKPDDWPTLGPLLRARAKVLAEWADDASLWEEEPA